MRPLKLQGNTDAHSAVGLRASMAFSPGGDVVYIAERDIPVEEVTEWLQEGKDLPDIIVMGFGAWIYSRAHNKLLSSLMAPDRMITRWRKMKDLVTRLAKRTTVLLVPQTRFRPHVVKSLVPYNDSAEARKKWWHELLYKESFLDHSNDWIDKVMSHFARGTGAVLWDSTLPMNLANVRECGLLKQAQQEDHPAYSDVMHCDDGHHPAPLTLQDEVTMLLNLLCNRDLNADDEHCCS
ncbi:uncharacterized protein [Macrobrachium rosenbergii]|uniref:uncharacterized protein n=1 Tax=Macrobrachium rosenbergii TaxID=79674 RepID=UPI0034D76213